jgi:hypothetical protein
MAGDRPFGSFPSTTAEATARASRSGSFLISAKTDTRTPTSRSFLITSTKTDTNAQIWVIFQHKRRDLPRLPLRPDVPPFEGRFPFVLTQHRHCAGIERELHAKSEVEPEPPHGQRPEGVAVTEADCLIDP